MEGSEKQEWDGQRQTEIYILIPIFGKINLWGVVRNKNETDGVQTEKAIFWT